MEKFLKRKLTVLHETDESSDDSDSLKQKKKPTAKQRKYVDDYVKYGFVESASDPHRPQYLICNKILSNEALKPTKLDRHLKKQHPDLAGKPNIFFQRKKGRIFEANGSF